VEQNRMHGAFDSRQKFARINEGDRGLINFELAS